MDQVYDNSAYCYASESTERNETATNNKQTNSKIFLAIILMILICLLVSVASLVCTFVLVNNLKDKIEDLSTKLKRTDEELKTAVNNQQQVKETVQSLPDEVFSLSVKLEQTQLHLQNLSSEVSSHHQSLPDEVFSLSVKLEQTQLHLQNLSSEVSSHHQVETDITCPSSYIHNPYANSCIRLVSVKMSWNSAKSSCESAGERLATFETVESQYWFINLRKTRWKTDRVWVGGEEFSAGVWRWIGETSKPSAAIVWGQGQPDNYRGANEACLESLDDLEYYFNDASCRDSRAFLCERLTLTPE